MKYLYTIIPAIILAYILVMIFVYFYQRNLLYHPKENNYAGDMIEFEYKEVFIEVEQNIKIKSWFIEKNLKKLKHEIFIHNHTSNNTSLYFNNDFCLFLPKKSSLSS